MVLVVMTMIGHVLNAKIGQIGASAASVVHSTSMSAILVFMKKRNNFQNYDMPMLLGDCITDHLYNLLIRDMVFS